MTNPEWEPLEPKNLHTNRILPVYPLTAKITQRWLRTQMDKVVNYWAPRVADPLPEKILSDAETAGPGRRPPANALPRQLGRPERSPTPAGFR